MEATEAQKSWYFRGDGEETSQTVELSTFRLSPETSTLTFDSFIGNDVSHGVMCPDYFAKAMYLALARALSVGDGLFEALWDSSAGHGGDAKLWFHGVRFDVELKWSSLANVGVQLGWQWKTLATQKSSIDIVVLFAHKAFQPWMQSSSPELFKKAKEADRALRNPAPKLTDHPATWFEQTSVLVYDRTQFSKKAGDGIAIPPSKLQLDYTRKFKGMDDTLHGKNVIMPCSDLRRFRNALLKACERCLKTPRPIVVED